MARLSVSLYEEERLPVEIYSENFEFGEIVFLTVGGFDNPDTVTFHLSPRQVAQIRQVLAGFSPGGEGP